MIFLDDIAQALSRAAGACRNARDAQEIITRAALPLLDMLQMDCASFYWDDAKLRPIRLTNVSGMELLMPAGVDPAVDALLRKHHLIANTDAQFARVVGRSKVQQLQVWAEVPECGVLALFSEVRALGAEERSAIAAFASLISASVAELSARGAGAATNSYADISKMMSTTAWELMNPLTAMMGYIELLRGEELPQRSAEYVTKLNQQVERVHKIVMALNPTAPKAGSAPVAEINEPTAAARKQSPRLVDRLPDATQPALRILLVHKNPAVLDFERSVLTTLGAEVISATTPIDAMQALKSSTISAVVLDDEMQSGWDGRDFFTWICEYFPQLSDRVLMTVSAEPSAEIQQIISRLGVKHITKPLQMLPLLEGAQHVLGLSASKNKLLN
jgi:CheY-like chemotaxis protein